MRERHPDEDSSGTDHQDRDGGGPRITRAATWVAQPSTASGATEKPQKRWSGAAVGVSTKYYYSQSFPVGHSSSQQLEPELQ